MISRLKSKLSFKVFDFLTRNVLDLKPLCTDSNANFSILTMLCKRDLYQYLVSIHSLFQYVSPKRVIVVNDGSLLELEIKKLKNACPDIIIVSIADYRVDGLPRGGCWERFVAVSQFCYDDYIVQLDADTLFINNPIEMIDAINKEQSFALPTETGTKIVSAAESILFALRSKATGENHIQIEAEARLDIVGDPNKLRYIRACAGFAGYAPGSVTLNKISEVSDKYNGLFGKRWYEWGTEQFCSNFILANNKSTCVLPIEHYDSVDKFNSNLSFVHFIGCYRFDKGIYFQQAMRVIKKIKNARTVQL